MQYKGLSAGPTGALPHHVDDPPPGPMYEGPNPQPSTLPTSQEAGGEAGVFACSPKGESFSSLQSQDEDVLNVH